MRRRDFLGLMGGAGAAAIGSRSSVAQTSPGAAGEQVDTNLRWFLLDSRHADFAATREALVRAWRAHTSAPPEEAGGRRGGERIIKSYLTPRQKAALTPDLRIGAAAVLDEFNYAASYNPRYAARRMHKNEWGDGFPLWGAFLEPPMRLPTAGEDRRLAHAMGRGADSVVYVGQENVGKGDGSSYLNRRRIRDFLAHDPGRAIADLRQYDVVVLCGTLSRFVNEGSQRGLIAGHGFYVRSGTAAARTQVVSHPLDTARLMGGPKLGSGSWGEPGDWTDEGKGLWSIELGIAKVGANNFVLSDAGGTLRPLTKVNSAAECAATADSFFPEPGQRGGRDRIFVHLADGSNPRNTTYVPTNAGGVALLTANTTHFDIYGVEIYQSHWLGSFHAHNSDWSAYACKWLYGGPGKCIAAAAARANKATGQFTSGGYAHTANDQPRNRTIIGCVFEYHGDGIYDSGAHDGVPINTTIRDCFFYKIGEKASRAYGIELANGDSHCIGSQGHRGLTVRNCRIEQCGRLPISFYPFKQHFVDPATILTDGAITNGSFDPDLGGWAVAGIVKSEQRSARFETGSIEQAVTIGSAYVGKRHVLKFRLGADEAIQVAVGTASGRTDIRPLTTVIADGKGIAALDFVPTDTSFVVKFSKTGRGTLAEVKLLTSLRDEPVYVNAFPPALSFRTPDGRLVYHQPYTDVLIVGNFLTNPIVDNPVIRVGQGIALHGDSGHYGYNGQIRNVKILHNRIEGDFNDGSIRAKWKLARPFDEKQIEIAHNVIRGTSLAFRAFDPARDEHGQPVGPSFWFHHNDVHVRADRVARKPGLYVVLAGVAGAGQRMILDDNIYRTEEAQLLMRPLWRGSGNKETASLALWRRMAPSGDRYDPNSKVLPFPGRERN